MTKAQDESQHERVIENRKARFDYEIISTIEVGIVLRGTEVKSVREGKISLGEGFVRIEGKPLAMHLYGVNIDAYGPAGPRQHTPTRPRTLLAHKREIAKLFRETEPKGLTIVPLKLYFKSGYAKLLVGVARGKTRGDKRLTIAKRDMQRDINRAMSKRQPR